MNVTELAAVAGTIGGVLSVSAFLPHAYRIVQRCSAADVSLLMYVAIIVASGMWMLYAPGSRRNRIVLDECNHRYHRGFHSGTADSLSPGKLKLT